LFKATHNHICKRFKIEPIGYDIVSHQDVPTGSGLGTSSTLIVSLIGVYIELFNLPLGEYDIAEMAIQIERVELKENGGKQDQYAAAFGGFNYMEFRNNDVIVNPIRIKDKVQDELENNILLYFTNFTRNSSDVLTEQVKKMEENNTTSILSLHALVEQAKMIKDCLIKGNIDGLGEILDYGFQQKKLLAKGIKLEGLSYATKLELLKSFNEKQIKETTDVETKKQEQYKKTLDNLNLALQTISKALSDVASLVAQSFQIELDSLEYRYQTAMGNIVGDTEEANQKRIETEKAYQAEKAQIERKAQLASLKFTLASALASGAQAVVAALALPPPASFIIAGINAGITAVQVGLIQTQINDLQSRPLRRGGLLQGGGLVSGPSHEQGGVYAGGGYTLEGNEAVINRQSTLQYSGLLSQINQSGGGRPIMVQSAMDSRLVEALAKQKSEPIRAYVVEQDITRAQTINRRLEQLASF
jgi:hypothetical protein